MFLKIMREKTNSKAKIDESQEKQFFLMIKRVSMIFFETFVQQQNDNLFFRDPKRRLIKENQEK